MDERFDVPVQFFSDVVTAVYICLLDMAMCHSGITKEVTIYHERQIQGTPTDIASTEVEVRYVVLPAMSISLPHSNTDSKGALLLFRKFQDQYMSRS